MSTAYNATLTDADLATTERKTYARTCTRCGGEYRVYKATRKPGACGRMECLEAEAAEHNAAVVAHRAEMAERRRSQPRRPRQQQPQVMGEWQMAVMLGRMGRRP